MEFGGYVVLPAPNSGREWLKPLTLPLVPAPLWIPEANAETPHTPSEPKSFKGENRHGQLLLEQAQYEIIHARYGYQEDTRHKICYWIGGVIAGGYLDFEPSVAALIEAAHQMLTYTTPWRGLDKLVRKSVERGLREPWDSLDEDICIPDECLTPGQLTGARLIKEMLLGVGADLDQDDGEPTFTPARPVSTLLQRRRFERV